MKTFGTEFDRLKVHFGYLNNQRLEQPEIMTLADLPSLEVLRGMLLGVFNAPASKFVRLLNTPAEPDGPRAEGTGRQAGRSRPGARGGVISAGTFERSGARRL